MPQDNDLVLLTGATGFVGFKVLIEALKAGFNVRCAIRSESKASGITSAPAVKALNLPDSAISFSVVPDITATGAYHEAAQGVTHIIHVASPLPSKNTDGHKNAEEVFIKPAVSGVIEMLEAAKRSSSVQKVVITSSVVALIPPPVWQCTEQTDRPYSPNSRPGDTPGPYETPSVAYCASKIASLNATDDWMKRECPSFGVVNIHPSYVMGPTDLANSRKEFMTSTNKFMAAIAQGKVTEVIGNRRMPSATVHVDDVAKLHVMSLQPSIQGYKGFIASTSISWDDIPKLVIENFPEAIEDGLFVRDATQPTSRVDFDTTETESVFSFKFKGLEDQVKDGLGQFVNLSEET